MRSPKRLKFLKNQSELKHVLYVDDEPDMRMLVQLSLENMGDIKTTLCETAQKAVESATTDKPQMIILDVMMPDMDGPSALHYIRNIPQLSDIPVVFLTGQSDRDHAQKLRELGANGVLSKPFNINTLSDQVKAIWKECSQ